MYKTNKEVQLLIIDGNMNLRRILSIPAFVDLHYGNIPTGGLYGFLKTLNDTIASYPKQSKNIIVWDGKRSVQRLQYYSEYKGNRKPKNEEDRIATEQFFKLFNQQKQLLKDKFLPSLGVLNITMQEHEADDVIYQLCAEYHDKEEILVVSEDKDMFQLIQHFPNVRVYRPISKQMVDRNTFYGYVGVPWQLFLLYKALEGDKSDNITHIQGVAKATILKFLKDCDINDPIKWVLSTTKKVHDEDLSKGKELSKIGRIYNGWGTIARNLELIDLSREEFTVSELCILKTSVNNFDNKVYPEYFNHLCAEYGLSSILRDFNLWIATFSHA